MSGPAGSKRVTRSQAKATPSTPPPATETAQCTAPSAVDPNLASSIDLTSDDTQPISPAASSTAAAPGSPAAAQSNKRKRSYFDQTKRSLTHERLQSQPSKPNSRRFDYSIDYKNTDLRAEPHLYRVGVSEQGVLLCQPYKSEILPLWRFKDPAAARESSAAIEQLYRRYQQQGDFIGQDMARKFLQMGYTRSRRYANHKDGRKYDGEGKVRELEVDEVKAESAEIFRVVWKRVEADEQYQKQKAEWKKKYG